MGIDVWRRRGAVIAPENEAHETAAAQPAPAAVRTPRVRVASGGGDWLLVQEQAWAGHQERLLAEIQATIGPERGAYVPRADCEMAGEADDENERRDVHCKVVCSAEAAEDRQEGVG